MRQVLLVVWALWVLCRSTRGWGEQGAREHGMVEQSTFSAHRSSMSLTNIVDAMSSHDLQWKTEGHLLSDIADAATSNKPNLHFVRKWRFLQEHVVHVLPSGTSVIATAKQPSLAQHDAIHMWLHGRYTHMLPRDSRLVGEDNAGMDGGTPIEEQDNGLKVRVNLHVQQILSHDNVWGAMRRMSLLDVVDGTTADKQANAVRRQGIDSALLRYAGLILSADTQTGVVYDVGLPPSLAGIRAQVTRVTSDNFNQVSLALNEFTFPMSASFSPTGDFVALVYREISSFTVYTLPPEYQYGGPVVGIISSASNSTSVDPSLPPGSISLPVNTYIKISLPMFSTSPNSNALCAFFASNGSIFVSNLAAMPNICLSSTLGDFSLVVQTSSTTSPTQNVSPPIATASPTNINVPSSSSPSAKSSTNWKLIIGGTCVALAGVAFVVAVALISIKLTESVKLFFTTRYTGNDEALQDSLVRGSIAPTAAVMRTKPALEIDVAHFSNLVDV